MNFDDFSDNQLQCKYASLEQSKYIDIDGNEEK